jgi:hypothetical protein
MKVHRQILPVLAVLGVAACDPMPSGTVKDLNVREWIGHSESQLIQSWGKPHHDAPMADGGRTIGYVFTNESVRGPLSQVTFPAQNCAINFTVDRNRIIDDATATGTKCTIGPHGRMHPPAAKT